VGLIEPQGPHVLVTRADEHAQHGAAGPAGAPQLDLLDGAAEAAYRDGWQWLAALLDYLRQNRRIVEETIAAMADLHMYPVEATYLAWIDARRIDPVSPALFFETYGIGLSEGSEFGTPGFVRLNFGCRRALLQEALKRLEKAVKAKQKLS